MSTTNSNTKVEYEKKPGTRLYNQDKVTEINSKRIIAAQREDAILYKIYCDALGFEPEEQLQELYIKGTELYNQRKHTEEIKKEEIYLELSLRGEYPLNEDNVPILEKNHHQKKLIEQYSTLSRKFSLYDENIYGQTEGKKELLQSYYTKFSQKGKEDLNKILRDNPNNKTIIGKIFNTERKIINKKLEDLLQ